MTKAEIQSGARHRESDTTIQVILYRKMIAYEDIRDRYRICRIDPSGLISETLIRHQLHRFLRREDK